MSIRNALLYCAIGFVVLLACVARIVHLDADPYYANWVGHITDEGRWSEIARNLALFGSPDSTPLTRVQLLLSPGYQAANYASFLVFDVGFWSARIFAAVSGMLIVVVAFVVLRRHVTAFALGVGVVILGFETNLLAESRMALPEVPSAFASLAAFLVLVLARPTKWSAFLAGVLAAVALSLKGTTGFVILIFPFIILFCPDDGSLRARIPRAAAFLAGLLSVTGAGLASAYMLGLTNLQGLANAVKLFLYFATPTDPYSIISRFFDSPELEARNLMLLGAWFCSWFWFSRGTNAPRVASTLYIASGVWAGWWLLVWSANEYLPGRYVVHLVVPAAIHIMAGVTLATHDSLARIARAMEWRRGPAKAAVLAWLVFPTAVFGGTVLCGLAPALALDPSRLSVRLASIAVMLVPMAIAAARSGAGERTIAGFLVAPVLLSVVWLTGRELGLLRQFWLFDSRAQFAMWALVASATALASFALARRPRSSPWVRTVQYCSIAVVATVLGLRIAPAVLTPTFSIRDASRGLGEELASARQVRALSATSMFLENRLRYRDLAIDDRDFDSLVILRHSTVPSRFLEWKATEHLRLTRTFPLSIHPRQDADGDKEEIAVIEVYRAK